MQQITRIWVTGTVIALKIALCTEIIVTKNKKIIHRKMLRECNLVSHFLMRNIQRLEQS